MFQNLDVFRTAMSLARHSGHAQALSAQNIANADTPDYHAKYLEDFSTAVARESSRLRATREKHLHGQGTFDPAPQEERRAAQDPNGNTISLEREMLTAVEAQRHHKRALTIYRTNLSLLRASLGR